MSNFSQFFGAIKSIQRGTIVIANASGSNTATITAVTTGKSNLHHLGAEGNNGTGSTDFNVRLVLTDSTTITASRSGSVNAVTVGYEIVEYY